MKQKKMFEEDHFTRLS